MMRPLRFTACLVLAALMGVVGVALPAGAEPPAVSAGLATGVAAPQFMLPVLNDFAGGKKWGPARWVGPLDARNKEPRKKLLIMSFFATYCAPCRREMPELARLYEAYKDQGLGVMLVSIDKGDEQRNEILALAKEAQATFPVLHDRFQVVARRYAAEQLPYMLFVDEAGVIKTVHLGYSEELKAGLENEVRAGLGLAPLPPAPPPAPAVPEGEKAKPKAQTKG